MNHLIKSTFNSTFYHPLPHARAFGESIHSRKKETCLYSWGCGNEGKLGDASTSGYQGFPTLVEGISGDIRMIACGHYHSMAATEEGNLYTWGWVSFAGQDRLMKETAYSSSTPCLVDDPELSGKRLLHLCGGRRHSLAVTDQHRVFAWGVGSEFQLGTGSNQHSPTPVAVQSLIGKQVVQVAAGWGHSLALLRNHEVYSWGWGKDGQLGHGDTENQPVPKKIESLKGIPIVAIACGSDYSVAVSKEGNAFSFGSGELGQLGHGSVKNELKPRSIKELEGKVVTMNNNKYLNPIACGFAHTFVVTEENEVFGFGWNGNGQLGFSKAEKGDTTTPLKIEALSGLDVVSIAAGRAHSLCLLGDGRVISWGSGQKGKLGNGNLHDQSEPLPLFDLNEVKMLACGFDHSVAVVT